MDGIVLAISRQKITWNDFFLGQSNFEDSICFIFTPIGDIMAIKQDMEHYGPTLTYWMRPASAAISSGIK